MHTGFARGVQKKIVIAPVAQPQRALRNPGQERKHNADFQAENDIEDDAQLCRHGWIVNGK